MVFLNATEAQRHYGVCSKTLRRWAEAGLIEFKRGPKPYSPRKYWSETKHDKQKESVETKGNGKRSTASENRKQEQEEKNGKAKLIYCRVSSSKQKDDLQRQIKCLSDQWPQRNPIDLQAEIHD